MMLNVNLQQLQQWARMYAGARGMIKTVGGLIGFKIPAEIDNMLVNIANGGSVDQQQIQGALNGQQVLAPGELPTPQIGERVGTHYMAAIAYQMQREGISLREIAEDFTRQGNPISHATVASMIYEYEEEMQLDKKQFIRKIEKWLVVGGLGILSVVAGHLLWH